MRSTCWLTVADWTSPRTLAAFAVRCVAVRTRPTPGATVSPAAAPAAVSRAAKASAAVMAESCGPGPGGHWRDRTVAEFSASGNSGAISPAATSSGLHAGLSEGPVKRESSNEDLHGAGERRLCGAIVRGLLASVASPAWPSTCPRGRIRPAPRRTSPPPISTTDRPARRSRRRTAREPAGGRRRLVVKRPRADRPQRRARL